MIVPVTINTPLESRYYGVYDNAGTWTQASGVNLAVALAVLEEIPVAAGVWAGTVYEDADTVSAIDTTTTFTGDFRPTTFDTFTGTFITVSDSDEVTADLSGECINNFDIARKDPSLLNNYILQQFRK